MIPIRLGVIFCLFFEFHHYSPDDMKNIIIAIPPTNTSDNCFPYCCQRGLVDIALFPSWSLSDKAYLICYMQADKLFNAVIANDAAAVRKCLASGTHVDSTIVRYQSFLFHLILLYSHYPLSIQLLCVCFSISPLSCSFAFFLISCLQTSGTASLR